MGFTLDYLSFPILYFLLASDALSTLHFQFLEHTMVSPTIGPLHALFFLSRKISLHPYTPPHSTGAHIIYLLSSYSVSAPN